MNLPRTTIGLILFTGCEKYLPYSLKNLLEQNYENIEFLFRDQSPKGEIAEWIKNHMPEVLKKANVTQGENLMHCGGHNKLIAQMTGDYYFCVSNDMWYPPDFVSKVVAELEKPENKGFGTATVKLMHWDFKKAESRDLEGSKTNILDSVGIGIKRAHHFPDLGQGEEDRGQYDDRKSIFGGSGGLLILRRSILEDIRYQDEYFDKLLHYKGDVDLAYRLQWAGQSCLFIPHVKVWHDRQVSGSEGMIESRKTRSRWAKENSFFGHLVTLKKNFDPRFSLGTRFRTWLYNSAKWIYILIFEPYLLKQRKEVRKYAEEIEKKKCRMKKIVSPKDIEKLFYS